MPNSSPSAFNLIIPTMSLIHFHAAALHNAPLVPVRKHLASLLLKAQLAIPQAKNSQQNAP
jgi:hypothetical protein